MIWIAFLLFLVSLLTVCKPPFYHAWLLSVAVAGLPWLFALVSLAVLVSVFLPAQWVFEPLTWGVIVFSGAAFVLFCIPVLRGFILSGPLQKGICQAFPEKMAPSGEKGGGLHSPGSEKTKRISRGSARGAGPPQIPDPFRFWRMFSGPLAKKVPFKTMRYYNGPGCALDLDFYPSQTEGPCPCIIVIHGGAWSSGNSRQLPELNSRLARSGYHVAAINYRLAPKYLSPLPVEDVKNAIAFLRKKAADLQIDPEHLVLLGRSAGGQIALQAAYTMGPAEVRGVIAYYAPADMVWGYSAPASRLIMDSCKVMEAYLGGSYSDAPGNYHAASPLETLAFHSVPTLLLHGKHDVLVAYEHSLRLARQLRARGIPHYLLSLPAGTHGFDYVLDGPEGQLATYAVRYFLRALPVA